MELKKYIELKYGNAAKLAKDIGAHAPDVSAWASGNRPVPHKYGAAIEKYTEGKVTRKELFPNDWQVIWPELLPSA